MGFQRRAVPGGLWLLGGGTPLPGLPTSCAWPSPRSIATHGMPPGHRFPRHGSVARVLQTSPLRRRLVETSRRIAFVILQTEESLPGASHPTSRW